MKTVRSIFILIVVGSFFFSASCNGMCTGVKCVKKAAPWIAIGVVGVLVYNAYQDYFKIGRIDINVQEVKRDVQDLKRDSQVIKTQVGQVKKDASAIKNDIQVLQVDVNKIQDDTREIKKEMSVLKENVTLLQEGSGEITVKIQDFRKETKKNFIEVQTDILVAKDSALQKLDEKEKTLVGSIDRAKDELKQDLKDSSDIIEGRLDEMQKSAEDYSTKEDIKILEKKIDSLSSKIASVKVSLTTTIKESEVQLREDIKFILDKRQKSQEKKKKDNLATLKRYIQKLEKEQSKGFNKKLGSLEQKIILVDGKVSKMLGIVLEK